MDTGNKSAHIGPNVGPNHIDLHGGRHLGTVDQLLNDAGSVVGDKDKEGQAEQIGYNFNNYFLGISPAVKVLDNYNNINSIINLLKIILIDAIFLILFIEGN